MKKLFTVVVLSLCIFGTQATVPSLSDKISPVSVNTVRSFTDKEKEIRIIGYMKDSHYPVYNLRGDSFGVWYYSDNHVFTAMELVKYVDFIDPQDVKNYYCEITCIDKYKHVIGLNPKLKNILSPSS